jgi:hypothetical protein
MDGRREIEVELQRFEKTIARGHARLLRELVKLIDVPSDLCARRTPLDSELYRRELFLEQCLRLSPEVMESFLRDVVRFQPKNPAKSSRRAAIDRWAENHHIWFPWAVTPLDCIALNIKNGASPDEALRVRGSITHASPFEDPRFEFSSDGYSLSTDGLGRESTAFAASVAQALASHAEKQVVIAKRQGLVSDREFRERDTKLSMRMCIPINETFSHISDLSPTSTESSWPSRLSLKRLNRF